MVRSLISLVLIVALLGANYSRYFIYAGFELNDKYIAAALCENIDKPMLNCKGKCYLAKKIKEAEEKEESREKQLRKSHFQDAMAVQEVTIDYPPIHIQLISYDLPFALPQRSGSIFHPPQTV
ncbi:hypothetical protein [Daejeonella sp. JGW-45]|uniref:hypothetical protein n=1 Tax=Daejeonella sp. JGW-45 TaxID=3034148 RepID=UPI0023EAEB97|nr:hypothetical protein [Daejeonella sp. JGW-45]